MADIYQQRVADLQERMGAAGHDAFVVNDADTVYYLSGTGVIWEWNSIAPL